jgi:rRNA maturation endonuclease Nob1
MKVAVKDANVLIDLIEADLLGLWFRVGIETHTTDLVVHELRRVAHGQALSLMIEAGNLRVRTFEPAVLNSIRLQAAKFGVSLADASVIHHASEIGATLLSGDRKVRREAAHLGLEVRGLLWVFDKLVGDGVLAPTEAAVRLKRTLSAGAFLPSDECDTRLRRWLAS